MSASAAPSPSPLGELLVRLAGERPGLIVLCGGDPGSLQWFGDIWPDRLLPIPPVGARLGVGAGVRIGGGDAIVLLDAATTALPPITQPLVMVSAETAHLTAAYRAGLTVCQPAWPEDLHVLLHAALAADEPILLFLGQPLEGMPTVRPGTRPELGEPRLLHRGRRGLIIGAGPTAPAAAVVANRLAERGFEVTALDSHTLPASSGIDPAITQQHLLVGPLHAPRAGALSQVLVRPHDLGVTAGEVAALLHQAR